MKETNKKRHKIILVLGCLLVFFFPTQLLSASDTESTIKNKKILYIKSVKATLYTTSSSKSKVVTVLPRGTTVYVLSSNKRWTHVAIDKKTSGWVYNMLLTKNIPKNAVTILEKSQKITGSQRARASLYSGTAAARGLTDTSEELNQKYPANEKALKNMESLNDKNNKENAVAFILEGGLK